ncbi:MAG: hypothetical protein LC745_05525 [Planctomycetia bacterium]|nr:hypothetical protein [Planctomycetia bacterium]
MYSRPVPCCAPGCKSNAEYKVAASWSAGRFNELKTYGLACESHYAQTYQDALRRRKVHPPSAEESQGEIGVFRFEKGKPDSTLEKVTTPG